MYPSWAPGLTTGFGGVHIAHLYSFLWFVVLCFCFVLFIFVLCFVCTMSPVSLDCPFLIAPLVFINISSNQLSLNWPISVILINYFVPQILYKTVHNKDNNSITITRFEILNFWSSQIPYLPPRMAYTDALFSFCQLSSTGLKNIDLCIELLHLDSMLCHQMPAV